MYYGEGLSYIILK